MSLEGMKKELFETIASGGGPKVTELLEKWNSKVAEVKENFKIEFNFVNKSDNPDPSYAHDTDAGFDLRSNEDITIEPAGITLIREEGFTHGPVLDVEYNIAETAIVKTGLYFKLNRGFEMQIRSRSGLAAKSNVAVLNGPGTIDEGYRGEIMVILTNHGHTPINIKKGDRIAQAVITPVTAKNSINLVKVDSISNETDRGSNGIGSTGTK